MSEPVDHHPNTGGTNEQFPEQRELLSDAVRERKRSALEGTNRQTPEQIEARTPRGAAIGGNAATGPFAPAPSLPPGIPARIGRYDVRELLGEGNYGRVYRADDTNLNRSVAIKTPFGIRSDKDRDRFVREAKAVAALHHPNVCPVYDAGIDGELPFIVMRYVQGGTLENLLKNQPPTQAQALRIVGKIAQGLVAAHRKGVTHRDLKPANVLYDVAEREMLIADFGFARIGLDASLSLPGAGTPLYMAPEQASQSVNQIGPCSDVYSLGVILYEILTGRVPFLGQSPFDVMRAHCFDEPARPSSVRPDLDPRFDDLCLKALSKQPSDRYASAKAFAAAIADCLRPPAVASPPAAVPRVAVPPPLPPPRPRVRTPGEVVEFPLPGGLKMAFCWIPPGECQLGSPKTEAERYVDEDRRGKFSTNGFWMGKYTVTQAEWSAINGGTPSYFQAGADGADKIKGRNTTNFPVEQVSWDMICGTGAFEGKGFLANLNALGGVEKVFDKAGTFALPHENAWEYACRGGLGNSQPFYFGKELNGTEANIDGNYPYGTTTTKGRYLERTCAVDYTNDGKYVKHPWGLMHMHGNVWEWCENTYDQTNDPVLRSGSWYHYGYRSRAAYRSWSAPDYLNGDIGFRLCLPRTS